MDKAALFQVFSMVSLISFILYSICTEKDYREELRGENLQFAVTILVTDLNGKYRIFHNLRRRKVRDSVNLDEGAYYLGNSWIRGLIDPNYIYLKGRYLKRRVLLFLQAEKDEVAVSVLRGKIETAFAVYREDEYRILKFSQNEYFMIDDLRFEIA
ncbi:MAG: hypothetical protein MSA90_02025 [Faecalicatena sp.]|uniref:hypothetical protein n=1 Tax=Faecalicatena sp. TaxID=2005360 RepID=UPI00258E8EF7|nr:hypothetical protein [Faecalicatena sp.]MCI6464233.1 hypothetical protein [Faecalicatena sp.]MDY5621200.1 hypothetical protein [Lachnospiraceae bacterium]